jgi:hypothetical protein
VDDPGDGERPTPDIGATVLIEAVVQQNGIDAPNGTAVEFLASGGQFLANGGTQASVNTVSGRASIQFTAAASGNYTIQARVRTVTRQVTVSYRDPDTDEELVIDLPLVPNVGSFDGGETVYLRHRHPPARSVTFDVRVLFRPPSSGSRATRCRPWPDRGHDACDHEDRSHPGSGRGRHRQARCRHDQRADDHPAVGVTFLAGVEPDVPVLYGLDPASASSAASR